MKKAAHRAARRLAMRLVEAWEETMLKIACITLSLALPASLVPAALWNNAAEAQDAKTKAKDKKKAPAKKAEGAKQAETPLSCKLYGRGC